MPTKLLHVFTYSSTLQFLAQVEELDDLDRESLAANDAACIISQLGASINPDFSWPCISAVNARTASVDVEAS